MAGSRLSRNHEPTVHPLIVLAQPADDNEMPVMAMTSFTTSWSKMTVLLMMAGDVYFFVTSGWIPNWRARRAMEMMAGRESCCPLLDDCLLTIVFMKC